MFLLAGIISCDSSNDEVICTFNVDDPINDLDWLKNKIPTTTSPDYSVSFYLYLNKTMKQKYFFVERIVNYIVTEYSREIIFNCKGDTLMLKGIESPPTKAWDDFFEENILIKRIWPNE